MAEEAGVAEEGDITVDFMEEPGVVLMVDTMVDLMEDSAADPMADRALMVVSAWARHFILPHGAGFTLGTPRATITTLLRQPMSKSLILRHLLLAMPSLYPKPKSLILAIISRLRLGRVRFHQSQIREDAKSGRQRESIIMNRAGIRKSKKWKPFQLPFSHGRMIPASNLTQSLVFHHPRWEASNLKFTCQLFSSCRVELEGKKMKPEKRTSLIISLVAALVLVPMVSFGGEEISGPPPTPLTDRMSANHPPVAQPLIPEGVFAVQLVEALRIGETQDEAQAESMLSTVGIEPKNGWIASYPVTPPMIGEIEKGVAGAADAGKLSMGKEQALKAVGDLKTGLGLSIISQAPSSGKPGGPLIYNVTYKYTDKNRVIHFTDQYETIPKEYRDQVEATRETVSPHPSEGPGPEGTDAQGNIYAANPGPEVINNYYYREGPPVVTYYPPPDPYYYLYAWVPYPFWYSGLFFGGFFILHDFHRHVSFGGHPVFVTNHVAYAGTHRTFVVDPVSRSLRGSAGSNRLTSPQVFRSPAVQASARTIVGLSHDRMASAPVSTAPRMANTTPSTATGRLQRPGGPNPGTFNGRVSQPARSNFGSPRGVQGRSFSPPAFSGRSFASASPRGFSAPSYSGRSSVGGFRGGRGSRGHR